jgi:hypothetical protein
VQPVEGESCASILEYLNEPQSQGKSYCGNTNIRGGWKQAACPDPSPHDVAQARPVPSRPEPAAMADAENDAAVGRALDRALDGGWDELRIESGCRSDAGFVSVELFGNGVGIWNREAQFRIPEAGLRSLLVALREADFAGMRDSYGGKGDPIEPGHQAPRVTCRVRLGVDGLRKQVVQLQGGRQSEELKRLANRILEECRAPARSGVRADDLGDGLNKVAEGALAAEAFHLLVNRRGEDAAAAGENWLLRVDGNRASLSRQPRSGGPAAPLLLELQREDLARLARQLGASELGALPANLYAPLYTDVTVAVLGRRKQIQARRFAGLTPASHGEKQRRFDLLFEELNQLKSRVANEGRPEVGASGH